MWKEVSLLLLVIAVYYTSEVEADYKYDIAYNPKDYAKYTCPKKFNRVDLSYKNKQHWTLMTWGSKDNPHCAIRDTKAKCFSKGRGKKTWMTFKRGYGEFHVSKYDHFSDMSSSSSYYPKPYKGKKGYGGKGRNYKNKGKYNKSPSSYGRYGKKGRYSGRSSSSHPFSSSYDKKKGGYYGRSSSDPYNNYGFKYGKYPSSKSHGKTKKTPYPKSYKKSYKKKSSKYPSSSSYKKKGGKYGKLFSSSDKYSSSSYGGKYGKPYSYGKKKRPSSSSGYYSSSNKYKKKGGNKKYGKYPGYGKYPSSKSSSSSSSSSYGYGKYPSSGNKGYGKYSSSGYKGYGKYPSSGNKGYGKYSSSGYKGYGKYPSSGNKGYGKYSSSGYKGYGKYPYSSGGKGRYSSRRGYSSSSSSSSSSGYSSSSSSSSSYSNTAVPVDFAIRALYFKIRGVKELTIYFHGPVTKIIKIKQGKELDPRKKTWICIQFDTLPVFRELWFTFKFGKKKKAKFWDLYIFSCCEVLKDKIKID